MAGRDGEDYSTVSGYLVSVRIISELPSIFFIAGCSKYSESIQLVEAYVMSICASVEKLIGATIHVVEGPAEVIREIRSKTRGADESRRSMG